jgi:predicted dehydrogenase
VAIIKEKLGIAMAGYGMIGRIHTLGYRDISLIYPEQLPELRLVAVSTSRPETAQAAQVEAGFEAWYVDNQDLVTAEGVHVVDCVTPNHLHFAVVMAALRAGKHVYCEKPLALNAEQARSMTAAAQDAQVQVGMTFNYRFIPAVIQARRLLHSGELGKIYSFRADYLHSGYQDPQRAMSWRLRKELAGGGALVDLGSHVIDLVRYLLGDFERLSCSLRTYIKERPAQPGSQVMEKVAVDDAAWICAELVDGALGTIHVSRFATGTQDDLLFEIYAEHGALRFNLMDANWLYWYDNRRTGGPRGGERGWTRLETLQRYPHAKAPPARSPLGWARTHTENQFAFLKAIASGEKVQPDIQDGLQVQLVMDTAYRSAQSADWLSVPHR